MNPKVSVVIPTYKRPGHFLKRALESVLSQTYENIELVIVDDNPADSPFRGEIEQFMESYENDQRVVYVKNKKNLGGGLARNEGIARASGDYISFLDDDDKYLPEKISRQLAFMESNEYDLTFTNLRVHNTEDKLIDYRDFTFIKDFNQSALLKAHLMRHITGTSTFMFRQEALRKIGGFQQVRMGQEFMLMLHSIEKSLKIGYLPICEVVQYVHSGERISNGINKLDGEKEMIQFKKQYFSRFTWREKMFIRFRHHAVMAITARRSNMHFVFALHACLAVLNSPIDAVLEPVQYLMKLKNFNKPATEMYKNEGDVRGLSR
ncbi:glycosyltransferase family 2 protein [Xylanibacillus composti]|uniref:Glycosyltransferase 2-like domain-containing protein n=1 Tax=Xylanibacillus composti TaxID=1572762 RepID=A0A8J4H6H7_9BACL|nr:glycosyltransferase family 2 protein [Xylanibacillus composti]MDT9724511.1 glycosyltransferase family 2 protein [Xylanibacillus composti]GIQ69774.1 hypothetical protein XYCOK13_25980 [Xylanibacillus composti]